VASKTALATAGVGTRQDLTYVWVAARKLLQNFSRVFSLCRTHVDMRLLRFMFEISLQAKHAALRQCGQIHEVDVAHKTSSYHGQKTICFSIGFAVKNSH
jgi:hypothetical protein